MTTTEAPTLKHCRKCSTDKPLEDFARDTGKPDGLFAHCRDCERARRAAAPHIEWEHTYRRRARAYGNTPIVESFTREELVARYGDACWQCGGEWNQLDHVIPVAAGGPHTLGNCRPSCTPENLAHSTEAKAAKARREARLAATRAGRGDLALAELRGQITTAALRAELATA